MSRVLTVALCLLSTALPAAAQTTGAGYVETLSGSMAASTNAMHKNIRRELAEEVGLEAFSLGPLIWRRKHLFELGEWDGQVERYYFVRTEAFAPAPRCPGRS